MLLISQEMAQNIVEELESVINENINIMDGNGIILASADPTRIGQFHGGAHRVITERLGELVIQYDGEYVGSRKGINFPIVVDDEVVGVVGLTGERDQVFKFGHVIKKMTEILILEYYRTNQLIHDERAKNNFLSDLIFSEHLDEKQVQSRAQLFGIPIQSQVFIVVFEVNIHTDLNAASTATRDKTIRQKILEEIRMKLRFERQLHLDHQPHLLMHGSTYVLFLNQFYQAGIKNRLQDIKDRLESAFDTSVAIGVGPLASDYTQIRKSYQDAVKAAAVSGIYFHGQISIYDELGIELLVEAVPRPIRQEIMDKVFRQCSNSEIQEWSRLLTSYFRLNGSINRIAEDLFIHKNTVQYRLSKLKDQTGFDVRDTRDAVTLYLAMLISNSLRGWPER